MPFAHEPDRFRYAEPPFQFNAPTISRYPPEVTGYHLLQSLRRRLGWPSLAGKRLLDFGCGVRFAQTIYNPDLEIGLYAGVDVNAEAIAWLRENLADSRFRFERLDMRNAMYNPAGAPAPDRGALAALGLTGFDAVCMFSVITHNLPDDSRRIFELVEPAVRDDGYLYFTSHTDEQAEAYYERDPDAPRHKGSYHPDYLRELAGTAGWTVEDIYPRTEGAALQQTAFVCRKARATRQPGERVD